MIGIELSTAVEAAVMARDGSPYGDEIRFRCPFPDRHAHGDRDPSAYYNTAKKAWNCKVCGAKGGCINLAQLIGVPLPSVGNNGTGRDGWPGLPPGIHTTWKGRDGAEGTLVAYWPYRTHDGKHVLGYTARYDYPLNPGNPGDSKPPKEVVPYFQKDAAGSWKPGAPKQPRPLFGMECLPAEPDRPVWVVEGEKKVEAIRQLGEAAVSWQGGAKAVIKADWAALDGQSEVCIWPDNDVPGREAARNLVRRLLALNNPPVVRVLDVDPLNLPEGGDIVDWWERNPEATLAELEPYLVIGDKWLSDSVGAVGKTEEWETPDPLEGPDPPPFPLEALPEPSRSWVEAEAAFTQTPTDLPAMLSISTSAAALAKKVEIEINDGWREPLNNYTLVLLESGNRKSAAFEDATRPFCAYERSEIERLAPLVRDYQSRLHALEARKEQLEKRAAKEDACDKRERLVQEAIAVGKEIAQLAPVRLPKLIVDDCTSERLATILAEQGGRIASMSAEGGVFDLMRGKYSTTNMPQFEVYLKGHAGDDIRVDRGSRPPDYVRRPAITMAVTAQPDVIRGLASERSFRGRGLLARFDYSVPRSLLGSRRIGAPAVPAVVRSSYEEMIANLCSLAAGHDNGSPSPHLLKLDHDALSLFDAFRATIEPELAWGGKFDSIRDWASKLPGRVARIAGILHMIAHRKDTEPWSIKVSGTTMQAAIDIGKYLTSHAFIALGMMGAVEEIEDAKSILGWIKRNTRREFSKRDVHVDLSHRFPRADDLDKPLAILLLRHIIRPRPAETNPRKPGRRPSPMFEVNPAVVAGPKNSNPQECQQNQQNSPALPGESNSVGSVGGSEERHAASVDSTREGTDSADLDEEAEWTG